MTDTAQQYHDLSKSVRRFDLTDRGGGVVRLNIWGMGPLVPQALPPDLPPSVAERDRWLRMTPHVEGLWSSALNIAITKTAALAWDIDSDQPRISQRMQELLLHADGGRGWVYFLSRHLRAYCCNTRGAVVEIARQTRVYGSRLAGIHHLPTSRCVPTGDPDIPILYHALDGREYELKWWQVIHFVDMPDDEEREANICAASRAYPHILKLAAIERYVLEKVSGSRPLEVHIVNGISPSQIDDAFATAKEDQIRQGHVNFMGVVLMTSVQADAEVSGYRIPLAELPDGFNRKEEFDIALLAYADALGLDPQDVQPLTGQQLGAGAQSQVLEQKAKGRGLLAWRQDFVHQINELVMPESCRFYFSEKDIRDDKLRAEADKTRIEAVGAMIEQQMINPQQGLQLLVDAEIAPEEFLAQDQTAMTTIGDDDKPESEADATDVEITPGGESEDMGVETKATADLLDAEIAAAYALAHEVLG